MRLSQPVTNDHADQSRVEYYGKVLTDFVRNEPEAVELRDKQHNDTGNEEYVAELGL